jgi:hypothetical protein
MRWRTIEEVKAGKGSTICANVSCGRNRGLEGREVVFEYVEERKRKNVFVKCILCPKCGEKLNKARGEGESQKRSKSDEDGMRDENDTKEQRHHRHRHRDGVSSHKHDKTRQKYRSRNEPGERKHRRSDNSGKRQPEEATAPPWLT